MQFEFFSPLNVNSFSEELAPHTIDPSINPFCYPALDFSLVKEKHEMTKDIRDNLFINLLKTIGLSNDISIKISDDNHNNFDTFEYFGMEGV